jgi:hypothetical protein
METQEDMMTKWTKPIPREDRDHIAKLHRWAAQAAVRGDLESSERLQVAASQVFDKAVELANVAATEKVA